MKSNPETRNEIRKSLSDAGSIQWVHGGLVFITLAATVLAWDYARDQSQEQVRAQFELEADRVLDLLTERTSRYQQTLLAGAAFIETIDRELTSDDWARFVGAMEIENRYPAMQGMGVVYQLRRSQVDTFVEKQRQNRPAFAIHPTSTRAEVWPVVYIFPVQGNEKAIGLDTAHEANRLTAAEATRDTGLAHITAPIELVQDEIGEPGFLLFAPIYKTAKHDTLELRREHFGGLVYGPLLVSELIDAAINDQQRQVALRIHDGERQLYADQVKNHDWQLGSSLQHIERRTIHGRTWKFDVHALPSFHADVSTFQPAIILAMGLLINAMLIWLFFAIARASRRALSLSDEMTSDLEKLALAAEINEIGVWDYDPVTGALDWDDTMFKVYGRRREDFSGAYEAWYDSLHVDDRESAVKALEESLKTDHPFVTEFRVVHLDGSVHHVSARGVVFRDESGTPMRMLGANSDITKLHEVTDRLEKSRELQAAMQDAAGVAMIATDVDGVIMQFNHAAEIMLGYSADEMIGRETPAVFHDADEIVARSAEMSKDGRKVEPGFDVFVDAAGRGEMDQREWTYIRKDGNRFPVLLTVTALRTKQKEIYGFLGCAANISERKRAMETIRQANENLARSNEELAQFAYVASHDLQAPLRRITSYLDLLVEELDGQVSEKAADFIRRIIKGSHRMRALIEDLLLYSRFESSDQIVSMCKSGRAVQHAIEDLSDFIRESDATVTVDNLPQIRAEPRQLKQLFLNLIGNAIKYRGDQPPRVHVSATSRSSHWLFAVEDNGIGIAEESRDRVFGIFKRLHLDDQYSGNGIGLAICKRIVDRMNGRIWVEESASGGCKFCFEVPKKPVDRHS